MNKSSPIFLKRVSLKLFQKYIQKPEAVDIQSVKMSPPSTEEVDLTSETPPRKMKQARLPFAPLNKQATTSPAAGK